MGKYLVKDGVVTVGWGAGKVSNLLKIADTHFIQSRP
jgi:hypothetical protein